MSPESKKSTREKAAAARAAAEAEQRRRDRRIQIIGGVVIAALVAGIIAVGYLGSRGSSDSGGVVADAAVPTGALTSGDNIWGMPYNTKTGAPVLAIWEDFQCPACAQFEATMGADVEALADAGTIQLIWRPTTFIENNFPNSPNPKSSTRAVAAFGCAVDAGKGKEFHNIVFANQPATEGDGWTDDQLLQFGKDAGITGDAYTTFESCFKDLKYEQWAVNSYTVFHDSAVPGTPSLYLNGTEIPSDSTATIDALKKYIADNS